MVILGNEIRLLSADAPTFLGLTRGRNAAEILMTTANSVVLYEVKTQKKLNSWNTSLVDNQLAVTPCCYDGPNNRFLAAFQNKVIRSWTSDDDRIELSRKFVVNLDANNTSLAVPSDVHAVISFTSRDTEAVVIYENGGISFMNDPATIIDSDVSNCLGIRSPWAFSCENEIHVGFLSIYEKKIILHHLSFDEKYERKSHKKLMFNRDELTFKDAHVYVAQDLIVLSILWSDCSISRGTYFLTSKEISWKNYPPLKEICCQQSISIISYYADIILAFISNDGDAMCVFYNLKYEAITTKRVLKSDGQISEIRLYNIEDQIYIQLGNDILLLPFMEETSNLSSLLGVRIDKHMEKAVGLDKPLMWSSGGLVEQRNDINHQKQQAEFSEDFLKLVVKQESLGKCDQVVCENLVEILCKAKDFDGLSEALRYFKNIPDRTLVDTLLCYLSSKIDCGILLRDEIHQLEQVCPRRYAFIDQILSIPINDVFLMDYLRKLPLDETVWLLWYLRHLLKSQGCLNVPSSPDAVQIVNWISMLLDANFHKFLLLNNDSLYLFLHNLASLVTAQVKSLEEVNALHESMTLLLTKGKQYESQLKLTYGIETRIFQ